MNKSIKHIVFIDADIEAQKHFGTYFNTDDYLIVNFASAIGAIQYIKESKPVDLLIIDEFAKPMGAAQTLNYLYDELQFKAPILVSSRSKEKFVTDTGIYSVVKSPFDGDQFKSVEEHLSAVTNKELEGSDELYSLGYLNDLSDGDTDFIAQSIKIFLETVTERMQRMLELLEQKDYEPIASLAHNIKPSFEMIENKRGKTICDFLAHHAKPHEVKSNVEELYDEFSQIKIKLKNDFPQVYKIV